jgi:hypothetical protein
VNFKNPGIDAFVKDRSKGSYNIKAIPVWLNGYRFRSKLEGRWAAFFNDIGIEYDYEPQGFKLKDGTCYLPDFWLPWCRVFAEVKPTDPTPEERLKCELTVMATGGLFLYLAGYPDFRAYEGVSCDSGMLTTASYSLDIHSNFKSYFEQHRLWSEPSFEDLAEENCSIRYRDAVHSARREKFNSKEMPKPGHEPFNPSPRDMGGF